MSLFQSIFNKINTFGSKPERAAPYHDGFEPGDRELPHVPFEFSGSRRYRD